MQIAEIQKGMEKISGVLKRQSMVEIIVQELRVATNTT